MQATSVMLILGTSLMLISPSAVAVTDKLDEMGIDAACDVNGRCAARSVHTQCWATGAEAAAGGGTASTRSAAASAPGATDTGAQTGWGYTKAWAKGGVGRGSASATSGTLSSSC